MLFTEKIEEIIRTVMWTGYVKNERPVSLMLVAPPESGKTELIMKCAQLNNPPAFVFNDLTITGVRNMLEGLKEGKYTHLVCPDFIKIISRKSSTVSNLTTMLNSLIEEGIIRIDIYNFQFFSPVPVRCGLISAMTPKTFTSRKLKSYWGKIGLNTRMVLCSWTYNDIQIKKIYEYIKGGRHRSEELIKIKFPKKPKDITMNKRYANTIEPISMGLAKDMKVYGFRFQKQLQTLVKARALMRKSDHVTKRDVNDVLMLSKWINLRGNEL